MSTATAIPSNWRVMVDREEATPIEVILRLLADHQREPHHSDMCGLCRDSLAAIQKLRAN